MTEEETKFKLGMAVPNGIILGLIGVLLLITPLATEMPENQVKMDLIAGAALAIGGGVSLVFGLIRKGRP